MLLQGYYSDKVEFYLQRFDRDGSKFNQEKQWIIRGLSFTIIFMNLIIFWFFVGRLNII